MRHALLLAAAMLPLTFPAAAQTPVTVDIELSNFKYRPPALALNHGQSYLLRFLNRSRGGHNFSAPGFFAAAGLQPADRAFAAEGTIEVPAGATRQLLVQAPAAGTYKVKCTHRLHSALGMKGQIVVR